MYKIYFDNRLIKISSRADSEQNYCLFHKYHKPDDLSEQVSSFMKDRSIKCLNIYSEDVDELWNIFREQFHFLEASGGIVKDDKKSLLLIKRYNRWDAPKGHFEPCETPEICARREIKEECGIDCGTTLAELPPSYHIYSYQGEYYLKKTHWFLFDYSGDGKTTPQVEEGISLAAWIDAERMVSIREEMWESVKNLVSEVTEKHLPHL